MGMEADKERYADAAHAMQSGVAYMMEHHPGPTTPKHLRVGVNSALVDCSAIAALLIRKGLFTEAEYVKELADAMEREAATYEKELSELLGRKVVLG